MNTNFDQPQVVFYNTHQGDFAFVALASISFEYFITSIKNFKNCQVAQRTIVPAYLSPEFIHQKSIHSLEEQVSWIIDIKNNINLHAENIRLIGVRLGWNPVGEGIQCCINFKKWIIEDYKADHTSLDLSGLGLTLVPLQIGLFKNLERIDLSNNRLRILPVEFQKLDKLAYIDLRNNPIMAIPDWLKQRDDIKIETDIIKSNEEDWAQSL